MEWAWKIAALPRGHEGYARLVRLRGGEVLAVVVTDEGLSPERRAQVRRELLNRCLKADGQDPRAT